MNPNDVIETYVSDVMARVPGRERDDIGLELRGLLTDMLAERAATGGHPPDDAMVLAMLRDFGTPADVAARYRVPTGIAIPSEQVRKFVVLSLIGIGLQWALTLPRVFQGQPIVAWWFGWGLGAFWWPGFLALMGLLEIGVRQLGWFKLAWRPRTVDSERVNRGAMAFGIAGGVVGAAAVAALPFVAAHLPGVLPQVSAFDPGFLRVRAWPVLVLWLAMFANMGVVLRQGRWSSATRWVSIVVGLGFVALFAWWLAGGVMFQAPATNAGARGGIALLAAFIVWGLAMDVRRQLKSMQKRRAMRASMPAA